MPLSHQTSYMHLYALRERLPILEPNLVNSSLWTFHLHVLSNMHNTCKPTHVCGVAIYVEKFGGNSNISCTEGTVDSEGTFMYQMSSEVLDLELDGIEAVWVELWTKVSALLTEVVYIVYLTLKLASPRICLKIMERGGDYWWQEYEHAFSSG